MRKKKLIVLKKYIFKKLDKITYNFQRQQISKMATEPSEKLKTIQHYSYFLNDYIGKGFSSTVYKGKNSLNGETVAIKVIDLRKLSQSTMRQLLQSEIQIVKSLNHKNILKCENVFITVNNCYIVTQLCQGGDLASQIKKKGRLRGVQALKIMLQITRGISHLSNLSIIHRDIKPANILLHKGTVKIADFGFARYEQKQGKKQKYSVGSPLYMSPQALFSNFYSRQNDIWSLGVVFYQILQGRPPWDPKNQKQLKQILKQKKQIFFRIAIRDQLQTIIRGCLKHQRSQRMSLEAILKILQEMMKQMMNQDNVAYRQTLTKRTHNTLSCKDLNSNSSHNQLNILTPRPLIPKVPKPPSMTSTNSTQLTLYKQNTKKQSGLLQIPPISRNRSAIQLKQRQPSNVSLQQASRHNHWILKSIINYSRLIYKNFSRLDKLEINQALRIQIQKVMVDLLSYSISWLKESVVSQASAETFGIVHYNKFKETGCYSKTILIINQYYERYTRFVSKTRKFLGQKKTPNNQQNTLKQNASKLKKLTKDLYVHSNKNEHNIGVDFIISIVLLSQMLQTYSTAHFAQFSHVQQIVETEPVPIVQQADRQQLMERLDVLGRPN